MSRTFLTRPIGLFLEAIPLAAQTKCARCRVRTCTISLPHKALTVADSQTDAQKIWSDAGLIEFMRRRRRLSGDMQRALLDTAPASGANRERGPRRRRSLSRGGCKLRC